MPVRTVAALVLGARACRAGFIYSDEFGRSYLLDLCFTSDGIVKLTLASLLFVVLYTSFGPQPVDERELVLNEQWAHHKQRGEGFFQVGAE